MISLTMIAVLLPRYQGTMCRRASLLVKSCVSQFSLPISPTLAILHLNSLH